MSNSNPQVPPTHGSQQFALPKWVSPGAGIIATSLSLQGLRSGSLSQSGAAAAFAVGYTEFAGPVKLFGTTMIVFYLLGSRATKYKSDVKATLEDGPDPLKSLGNRNWVQVLSNSLPSLVLTVLFNVYCADAPSPYVLDDLARRLIFAGLGQFAAVMGDTLASELGILSSNQPVHILTGRTVPPGTNGGITPLGLFASAAGGAIMGLTMVADLAFEDPAIRRVRPQRGGLAMVAWGTAAGLIGSLIDSLLGATLQKTKYSTRDGRVLTDLSHRDPLEPGVVTIGPGLDVLSNSGVNFVTACVMAGLGFWVGGW